MLKYLRQLASESLVYGLAGMVSRFLSVFLVPAYTRIFTPEDYGVMSLVTATMAVVSIFVVLALDNSAHRWYWDTEDVDDRKCTLASWTWCQIVVSSVFALIIFLSSNHLGQLIVGRPDAGLYFRLTALALPLSVLEKVTINWLRMQRRPWATMSYTLGTNLLAILLAIFWVISLGWGLSGVYVAQIVSTVFSTAIAIWLMGDWVSPWRFRLRRLGDMLRYAQPLIPSALCFWIVNFSDRYIVELYTTTSEVGLYQVGSSIAAFVALITGAFQLAWGPFAMSIHKQPEARQVYANVFLAYIWLTTLVSTAVALFAPEAIRLFATEQYLDASSVVGLLAFSYMTIGLMYIAAIGPAIVKTSAPTGVAITLAAALNIGLNFLLIPQIGKEGAALATLLSQSLVPVYLFWRSQQMYPIPYRFRPAIGIIALAAVLMWLGTSWQFSNLWVNVGFKVALVALFIPALLLFQIVTSKQFRRFLSPANRLR